MISENTGNNIIEKALSKGGVFAEIFMEDTKRSSITMINGKIEKSMLGVDYGLGLRIFTGEGGLNQVYAYTNDCSEKGLLKLATEVSEAVYQFEKGKVDNKAIIKPLSFMKAENIHTVIKRPSDVSKSTPAQLLKEMASISYEYDKKISQTSGSYGYTIQDVLIMNSEGLFVTDTRVRNRMSFTAIASSLSEKQTATYSPGSISGYEFIESLNPKEIAIEQSKSAITMLESSHCPSGTMPVVIDNGFGGVIFHEACGHSLEATSVAKGASVFCNKMGEQIANKKVTAIDDGTLVNDWGSINIDDEGHKSQKNILIKDGILNSYLVDKLNGKKMGMESTGSGRRESYHFAPTSRMTNTYIDNGTDSFSDMITNTEYGLYAKKMGGGSVEPATGEFNFSVREGYLIENGKITKPVRGATLIGKGSEVLMNIDFVGDNLLQEQGMCGSSSGQVPTNVGQPAIRVSEMIVGGRG